VTAAERLMRIHDLDLLALEMSDPLCSSRLRRLGFAVAPAPRIERWRGRLIEGLEARWRQHYERALRRYGSGVAAVRGRVCQGCFVTLPRSVAAGMDEGVSTCEACGRILFWGLGPRGESD